MKTPLHNPGRLITDKNNDNHNFFATVEYTTVTERIHRLDQIQSSNDDEVDGNNGSITRTQRATPDASIDLPSVRLTEGPSPLIGRLQIYHRGQWRSVCSNSRK